MGERRDNPFLGPLYAAKRNGVPMDLSSMALCAIAHELQALRYQLRESQLR